MTKLVDLFNEYNRSPEVAEGEPVEERTETEFLLMSKEKRAYMLSKDYGFIKWLVDNDKIDFSREGEYCTKSIEEFDGLLRDDVDGLIMLLSISDTPIDDLISYLK